MEEKRTNLHESVDWFLDHLKGERGASPHTVLAYNGDLSKAVEFFCERGLTDWEALTTEDLYAFETSLGAPLKRTTVLRRVSSLRSLLKFLKRNKVGPTIDLPSTGGFKKPKTLPKALSSPKLEGLVAVPDLSKPTGLRDRALIELVYGAGLRISECVELERDALDLEEGAVRVIGKRDKVRIVPLPQETIAWIKRYLQDGRPQLIKRPTARVFISDTGLNLRRQTAYTLIRRYAVASGIGPTMNPHTLRHTYAVHLLQGGADLRAVQELLGHESVSTTEIYTQLDLAEVRRKYEKFHPRE